MQFDFVEKYETNLEEIKIALKALDDDNIKILEDGLEISNLAQVESIDEESDDLTFDTD